MLKASEAIVVDEYFGPVPEESQEEKMPALLRKGLSKPQFTISLGPGPLWWS